MPMNPAFPSLYDLRGHDRNVGSLAGFLGIQDRASLDPGVKEHQAQLSAIEQGIMQGSYDDKQLNEFVLNNPAAAPFIAQAVQRRNIFQQHFKPKVAPNQEAYAQSLGALQGRELFDPTAVISPEEQSRLNVAAQGQQAVNDVPGAVNALLRSGQIDEARKLAQLHVKGQPKETALTYAKIAEGYHPDTPLDQIPPDRAARILARSSSPVVISTPTGNYAYPRGGVPGNPANVPAYTPRPERTPEAAKDSLRQNESSLKSVDDLLIMLRQNPSKQDIATMKSRGISSSPDAVGWKGYLPDFVLNRMHGEGVDARAVIQRMNSMTIKELSGVQVSPKEEQRLKGFLPYITDDGPTAIRKLIALKRELLRMNSEIRRGYAPEQGYVPLPTSTRQETQSQQPQSLSIPKDWNVRVK